jgi:hypothetical protein
MKDYETAWKILDNREKTIDEELRQPGLSTERRRSLEAEKQKVKTCKTKLIQEFKSDGDREKEAGKQPVKTSEETEKKTDSNNLEQVQKRQWEQEREHVRDLEIQKWAEHQRG